MKSYIRKMILVLLCFSIFLCLIACNNAEVPAETTENEVITTEPETTKEETTEMEEIKEAESAYKVLGAKCEDVIPYSLPEGYGERLLAVVKKVKNTPPKYPRGQGKERKQPL